MKFKFHPEARSEFLESAAFYEACSAGLGMAFADEIESTINGILEAPERWRCMKQDIRRCFVHRFPYGILYSIESDFILIIAIMHCSRKPGYWRTRIAK